MSKAAFAPAKVNLFLHIGAAARDGMHPLCSLMVFADVGDRLALEPAEQLSMRIVGPFSAGLSADEDNLVMRAARALFAAVGRPPAPVRLVLDKRLPVASGLGGGSSDAGAALRLLRDEYCPALSEQGLGEIAAGLGSDGPACLFARPVVAEGRGERLSPAPALPVIDAVLVNPGVASPTGAVYRAFDQMGAPGDAERPPLLEAFADFQALAAAMAALRNDLEPPAVRLNAVIGEALEVMASGGESALVRVSGSGATCFALCADRRAADALAARLRAEQPSWWVRPCRLGGPWT